MHHLALSINVNCKKIQDQEHEAQDQGLETQDQGEDHVHSFIVHYDMTTIFTVAALAC